MKVEKKLGFCFPDSYKQFLVENNGGEPDENYAFSFYEVEGNGKTSTVISCFYSINCGEVFNPDDLVSSYCALVESEQVPIGYLPIAEDVFGNYVLISCVGEHQGCVFFGNAELENAETGFIQMSMIAESFSEFINMLYKMEE